MYSSSPACNGALYSSSAYANLSAYQSDDKGYGPNGIYFNASRYSSVYKNNAHVKPNSYACIFILKY